METKWEFKNPQAACKSAIATGRLSDDPRAANYAGAYMYMGTKIWPDSSQPDRDLFKHKSKREYIA